MNEKVRFNEERKEMTMGYFKEIKRLFKEKGVSGKADNPKRLCEYTDDELFLYLENNETADVGVLACICSEVLRRKLEKEKINE